MIIPDSNLLLYACDTSSPFHRAAAGWWAGCLNGPETVGLAPVVVLAFVRVGTSGAAFDDPLTLPEASAEVRRWLDRTVTAVVEADSADLARALTLVERAGAGGGLATDALIAATALRHRAVVHTADTDFARFPDVTWFNPITGRRG